MPEPFSLSVCALKICAAVTSILAAHGTDNAAESAAQAIEGLLKGGEAVKAFRERDQQILGSALRGTAKRLEALYQESLKRQHSSGFRENVEVAFANLSEAIAKCLPSGEALARMGHDPGRIAAAVVDAALALRMDVFSDPYGEARRILTLLVQATYEALKGDAKFMDSLQGVNWAETFARLERIEGKIDDYHSEVMEALRRALPATAQEKGVPEAPLRAVLEKLGASQTPAAEIAAHFDLAVDELLRLRADLARMRDDRPEFAAIRKHASDLIDKGEFDAARSELQRGRETARALREEISRSEAGFLADEARVDRLELDYDAACAKFAETAHLDPSNCWIWIDLGDLWRMRGSLANASKAFGGAFRAARNTGDERDLSVSHNKIGDVLVSQGNLPEAVKSYAAGLAIRERLARSDAGNTDWQRDLIVSCVKIAQVFPGEARAMLTQAGAIANRLRDEGRLAPVDAWMPDELAGRLAALLSGA